MEYDIVITARVKADNEKKDVIEMIDTIISNKANWAIDKAED